MENATVELWACDFNLGAEDNCTPEEQLRFTFSDIDPSDDPNFNEAAACAARVFDCDDVVNPAGTIVPVNVYVWDTDGNSDFCTVFLTLVDNTGNCDGGDTGSINISGAISTESGQRIEEVMVNLVSDQPQISRMDMTDNAGTYMFETLPADTDYQLTGERNSDYLNGISTVDLITCLLYTSPSPRDRQKSRMPSSA